MQPSYSNYLFQEISFSFGDDFDLFINPIEDDCQSQLCSLLSTNTKGKYLLEKAKNGQTLTSRDRLYIVAMIVEAELQLLKKLNQSIRKNVWQTWSNGITTLFKGESKVCTTFLIMLLEEK